MQTPAEEYHRRARSFQQLGREEKDPDRREDLLDTADEYLELIKLLQDA